MPSAKCCTHPPSANLFSLKYLLNSALALSKESEFNVLFTSVGILGSRPKNCAARPKPFGKSTALLLSSCSIGGRLAPSKANAFSITAPSMLPCPINSSRAGCGDGSLYRNPFLPALPTALIFSKLSSISFSIAPRLAAFLEPVDPGSCPTPVISLSVYGNPSLCNVDASRSAVLCGRAVRTLVLLINSGLAETNSFTFNPNRVNLPCCKAEDTTFLSEYFGISGFPSGPSISAPDTNVSSKSKARFSPPPKISLYCRFSANLLAAVDVSICICATGFVYLSANPLALAYTDMSSPTCHSKSLLYPIGINPATATFVSLEIRACSAASPVPFVSSALLTKSVASLRYLPASIESLRNALRASGPPADAPSICLMPAPPPKACNCSNIACCTLIPLADAISSTVPPPTNF